MARFFTSDQHFFHKNILNFEHTARPFESLEEMHEVMIDLHNSNVRPQDMVYFLGDEVFGNKEENLGIIPRLNGRKVFLSGNHDYTHPMFGMKKTTRYRPLYQQVFDAISHEQDHVFIAGRRVELCHFPYEGDSHEEDRHSELRPVDEGRPLLHGHVHSKWKIRGRQFNVGVDVNNLTPVHEDEICDWLVSLEA